MSPVSPTEVCSSSGTSLRAWRRLLGRAFPASEVSSLQSLQPAALVTLAGSRGSSLWGQRQFCVGSRPHSSMMGNHGLTNPGLAGVIPTVPVTKATAAAEATAKGRATAAPSPRTGKKGSVFPGEAGQRRVWQPKRRSSGCCVGKKDANSSHGCQLLLKALLTAQQEQTSSQV